MKKQETRGRPKKDPSLVAVKRRIEARRRFKEYFTETGMTQEEFAEQVCRVEPRHVQRLLHEAGDHSISKKVAKALEHHSGIIAEYWTGETIYQNRYDYLTEAEFDREREETTDRIKATFRATIDEYQLLFSLCGFRYECLADPSSVHDMVIVLSGEEGERMAGEVWHRLTAYKDPSVQYHFTQARFASILQRLQDTVAFECFRNNENGDYDGYDGRRASQILTSV